MRLDAVQSKHALRVLRLAVGDEVTLLDGQGTVAQAVIDAAYAGIAACRVTAARHEPPLRPRLTLATAIPKGPRGDTMINDLAQLGVDELVPLITRRSVVHPRDTKLERYHKAAIEAAKQSGRAWFMQVRPATALGQVFTDADDQGLGLIADPCGEALDDLGTSLKTADKLTLLIGPEGGFTDGEVQQAQDAGFARWRFSQQTLRIGTAAAAAVAIVRALT